MNACLFFTIAQNSTVIYVTIWKKPIKIDKDEDFFFIGER